jgi:aspartyl protease family protein
MVALLLLVIGAFGGLLVAVESGRIDIEALSGWPTGAVVIGTLIMLYVASLYRAGGAEQRFSRALASVALLVVAGFGVEVLRGNPPDLIANLILLSKDSASSTVDAWNAPASVRIRRGDDGAFTAHAEVNGIAMPMLLDSGAATIVLRRTDAERAGVDVRNLDFDTPLKTANGTSYVAPARLKSVSIGPLALSDVEALVAKPGTLNESLLGMSFLRRLRSYQVAGNFVTLRQ